MKNLFYAHTCYRSSPKDSRYTILVISLSNSFDLVLRRTERTRLSLLKFTPITKPRGHNDLGVFSSTIKTRSPTQKFLLVVSHLENASAVWEDILESNDSRTHLPEIEHVSISYGAHH